MDEIRHFIAGHAVGSKRQFAKHDPATGVIDASVSEGGAAEVDAAVTAARSALRGPWRQFDAARRGALLHAVAAGIEARFDEFVAAEVADTGKPASLARHLDIPRGAANFRIFADAAGSLSSECFPMSTPDGAGALNYALRVPRGVIAVICPWNLPLLLMTWKVAPALAAGNTVVVKPSEETPRTASLLGEVMNAVGLPAGVFNVVHGFGAEAAGEHLVRHPGVDAITFTGETSTGTAIIAASAAGIKPVSMELGGKNAALVFADCHLDTAIEATTRSVFANCGQVCLGTERIYVERPLFERFVARLAEAARALRPGAPAQPSTTLGPLISHAHREKVLAYYARARTEGAVLVAGGAVPTMPADLQGGAWIEPTIWTGLPESSTVLREEIFGPCCHVAPFDSEEQAITLANDTPYGLAASVYTSNLSRAHRVAAQLDVGVCWINSWFLRDLRTPFGGSKRSGIGREGGVHSFEFYTELRNVCVKL
ncbi:MAG: 2-hydroxymuconic semialdehyde dehydrogenase [Proteobacteria bacterium]|nr:2-hydroxymuconic semialdehyde dehydrogenase [Pseudomonadota bacterium]